MTTEPTGAIDMHNYDSEPEHVDWCRDLYCGGCVEVEPECMSPDDQCADPDSCDSIRCARERLHLTLRDEADQREAEPESKRHTRITEADIEQHERDMFAEPEPHVDPCDCDDCKAAVQGSGNPDTPPSAEKGEQA